MTSRPAQEQTLHGRAVLGGPRHRTNHEKLIEGQIPVMPMAAADAKLLLHIGGVSNSAPTTQPRSAGGEPFQRLQGRVQEALTGPLPQPSLSAYGAYCTMADSTCCPGGASVGSLTLGTVISMTGAAENSPYFA